MNKILLSAFAAAILLAPAALQAQIADKAVHDDFAERIRSVNSKDYFKIFDRKDLTPQQRDALEVLYAYMPLPDITDYSGEFFLENVDVALKARKEMAWGNKVPDREFRHFVLPIRVNNEALDGHRAVFYEELRDRVKDMDMKDAILEINHWCHEKATYQPSDSRTHPPLSTVYTAIGRCGEESTFTVAALRAMGIPARQVYTPRWAHTDDNHAWVEAWADGQWYFLGACEPEAVLNLGWFNAPASRGMLMNSRVYGRYDGPEEQLLRKPDYTDINVTTLYAPVDTLNVQIVDLSGKPVADASVDFCIYNYGEFYPIVTKTSDANGRASLITGLGDVMIWASKGSDYGFAKGTTGNGQVARVVMDRNPASTGSVQFDIVPPKPGSNAVEVSPEAAAENLRRFAQEDSIRNAYTSTFLTAEGMKSVAAELGLPEDRVLKVFGPSRANHKVLKEFLLSVPTNDRDRALHMLETLSTKDLSDVVPEVLADHITATPGNTDIYYEYVLCPRIDNEPLSTYRTFFTNAISAKDAAKYRKEPQKWVKWVADNIKADQDWYPEAVRMKPEQVWKYRHTSPRSRDIFFVASARSMGIPARIDHVTQKTQWADERGTWHDADFSAPVAIKAPNQGTLEMSFTPVGRITDPKYYTHFTLSKITDGVPATLNYPDFATYSELFSKPVTLDAGQYMLISGQRMADGSVLANTSTFLIEPDKTTKVTLDIRRDESGVPVIGNFDAESKYLDLSGDEPKTKSILSTTGRGYYVLGVIKAGHEPSNHTLRDIAAMKDELEEWGRPIVLLFESERDAKQIDPELLAGLPSTVVLGIDADGSIAQQLTKNMELPSNDRPIFIIADTFNRVVFLSQGYTIGVGNTLLDTVHKLKE
ncbi:MAG: transglutaminase domain-containing protein [Muribaculaceae bacterium]|nr:transglutaminase domain-containing protein [Muribaculaceae bacterium]